jgi:hypothetical protein
LLLALTLRSKKIYFEQLLHTVSLHCGKVVDLVLEFRVGGPRFMGDGGRTEQQV